MKEKFGENISGFFWQFVNEALRGNLSEESLRELQDKTFWISISIWQGLSENFIRKFQDKVDWDLISINQTLSENFIREFQDKVNWIYISTNQKLSEDFIREFQDKVDWFYISANQKLSEYFVEEFKDRIDRWALGHNPTMQPSCHDPAYRDHEFSHDLSNYSPVYAFNQFHNLYSSITPAPDFYMTQPAPGYCMPTSNTGGGYCPYYFNCKRRG